MTSRSTGSPAPSPSSREGARPRSSEHGFTLIEVLVAFVILALALGAVSRVFSDSVRRLDASSGWETATFLAEARIGAAGVATSLEPGERRGNAGGGFSWSETVTLLGEPATRNTPLQLYEIGVTVDWNERGAARSLRLTTLRAAPRPASR